MSDVDRLHYDYQEAAGLRKRGWTVEPPVPPKRRCKGVDDEGCPVMTPRVRCRWCRKTRGLRRAA